MRTVRIKECFLFAVLGTWLVLSALRQIQRVKPSWIRRLDPFRLVPNWRFFGPNPLTWDYRLYLRFVDASGAWSKWTDITPNKNRGKLAFIWNPQRRPRKVFFSACRRILAYRKSDIRQCSGHKVIIEHVLAKPRSQFGSRRQFEIARCRVLTRREEREVLFRSEEYVYGAVDPT
jgi:hypothetical protein